MTDIGMQQHSHLAGNSLTDLIPVFLFSLIGISYFCIVLRLKTQGKNWNLWQLASFTFGIILLVIANLPSVVHWGHTNMQGHMVQHLLIAMYAPIFLVLGAPVMLGLKILPPEISRKIMAVMKFGLVRFISHPGTALFLNTGAMFLLYLTPLYNLMFEYAWVHYFIHFHFLAAGYLFTWSIIGIDPIPNRVKFPVRLLVLFVSMAAHAFLSKFMYAFVYPLNSPHSDQQIREGAKMMYYWGDFSELLILVVLFVFWYPRRSSVKAVSTL